MCVLHHTGKVFHPVYGWKPGAVMEQPDCMERNRFLLLGACAAEAQHRCWSVKGEPICSAGYKDSEGQMWNEYEECEESFVDFVVWQKIFLFLYR